MTRACKIVWQDFVTFRAIFFKKEINIPSSKPRKVKFTTIFQFNKHWPVHLAVLRGLGGGGKVKPFDWDFFSSDLE